MRKALIVAGTGVVITALFFAVRFSARTVVGDIAGTSPSDLPQTTEFLGADAPYFDLPNLAGDHVALSDFRDTPLIVVFFATWNSEAIDQLAIIDTYLARERTADHLVNIVAINSLEEKSVVSSFMRRGGYRVPTLLDVQGSASEAYRIKGLPTSFFVDRTGVIQTAYTGVLSERMLVDKIEAVLK